MTWVLAPSGDRALARRVAQRLDQILGYPRTHAEPELTRRGRGPHAPTVSTETLVAVHIHSTTAGATLLRGAIAIGISEDARLALRERFVEHNAVRKRIREWIADQGWESARRPAGARRELARRDAARRRRGQRHGCPDRRGRRVTRAARGLET